MLKNLSLLLVGAVSATALVVACGDDSPGDADAAGCSCDPSEPPLAGRIVRLEDRRTLTTPVVYASLTCAEGALLLGGGCYTEATASLRLVESGAAAGGPLAWSCEWANETSQEVTVVAWATCLLPAPP